MRSNIYFKRDLYAVENDRKLRTVCKTYPVWGEAVFFNAVCMMYRVDGDNYDIQDLVGDVADSLYTDDIDKVQEIIAFCTEVGLFKKNGKKVWSDRVKNTCSEQKKFKKMQAERGSLGGKKKALNNSLQCKEISSECLATAKQPLSDRLANNKDQDQDQEKNKEKEKGNITDVIFPKKKDENKDSDSVSEESEFALLNEEEEKVETVKDNTPYKEITDYWNQGAVKAGYPQIAKLTNGRKVQIKCRWDEFGRDVFKAMDNVFKSDFLKKWGKCTIDWMMTPSKMLRAIEGMYRNDEDEESDSSTPKKMYKDYSHITDEDLEEKFSWEK